MLASQILQKLFRGGLLPFACTLVDGRDLLRACAHFYEFCTVVLGVVDPGCRYIVIEAQVVSAFDKNGEEKASFVFESAGKTFFAFIIDE